MNLKPIRFIFFLTLFSSCISVRGPIKNSDPFNEVEIPFLEENYPSTDKIFFQIVNGKNKNLNLLKQRVLLNAKTLLSQKLNSYIISIASQDLRFDSQFEIEKFKSKSKSISVLLVENLKLVDSKLYKDKDGSYEYWAVFSVDLFDIIDLNKTQNVYSSKKNNLFIKNNIIQKKTVLNASELTQPNIYLPVNGNDLISIRDKIEIESLSYLGVPYVWGGSTPDDGFDCSGFVRWVYKKVLNKLIERTTENHYYSYKDSFEEDLSKIKKGDLIYFKTLVGRQISHVGIYLENNKFIHSPNKNEKVKIQELKTYWKDNYIGFLPLNKLINRY